MPTLTLARFLGLLVGAHQEHTAVRSDLTESIMRGSDGTGPPDPESLVASLVAHDYPPCGLEFASWWIDLRNECASAAMGLSEWRKLAIYTWGSVAVAYQQLRLASRDQISASLRPAPPTARPVGTPLAKSTDPIRPPLTALTGYLSVEQVKELLGPTADLRLLDQDVERVRTVATANFYRYAALPRLDVYVATSMRTTDEFIDVGRTVDEVFVASSGTGRLDYFDPTQAFHHSRLAKALLEGVMLARARATLYLAQRSDTLGKDSELAATLARGRPVVAFIPTWSSVEAAAEEVADSVRRVVGFAAGYALEGFDEGEATLRVLAERAKEVGITRRLPRSRDARTVQIAERLRDAYEKRGDILQYLHPLGLQIDQSTGVANGVLVARSLETCREVLVDALRHALRFDLMARNPASPTTSESEERESNWEPDLEAELDWDRLLVERRTRSVHRFATGDAVLSRAFSDLGALESGR